MFVNEFDHAANSFGLNDSSLDMTVLKIFELNLNSPFQLAAKRGREVSK